MTSILKNVWVRVNKVLTIINVYLFGLLTFSINSEDLKKVKEKKVPLVANLLLLVFLSLALFVAIYK